MRIDLHIHTQKTKQGDSNKRNISPENFVQKMNNSKVEIAAITNHNKFDIDEFNEIMSIDNDLVLFPGIELDVRVNSDDSRHIIIICDPEQKNKFHEIFDDENRNYDDYYLEYSEFIDKILEFKKSEIMIIPHFLDKDKKRSITGAEKEKIISDLADYVLILEPSSLRMMGVINAHDELSLIGSDVTNWDEYNPEKLPELKFKITSFSKFYELTSKPALFVKTQLEDAPKISLTLSKEISPFVYDCEIDIFNDVNIVFGEKGSGKTYLLERNIHPTLVNDGKSTIFHKGSESENEYEKLIQKLSGKIQIDSELKESIFEEIDYLLNYSEGAPDNFIEKYTNYKRNVVKNRNAQKIQKTDTIFISGTKEDFDKKSKKLQKNLKKIVEVDKINIEYREDGNKHKLYLKNALQLLKREIIDKTLAEIRKSFVDDQTSKFLNSIKQSVKKKTDKESRPNDIGLSHFIEKRIERIKINKKVLNNLLEIQESYTQKIGTLPGKGDVKLDTDILVLSPEDKHVRNSPFIKNTIVQNRNIIKKISDFDIVDFKNVNDCFTHEEKERDANQFVEEIIVKSNKVSIDGDPNYEPSTGERSILSVSAILEDYDYDYYLFDEIERGLGNKYIFDYILPSLNNLRDMGKTIILTTHNANIAINSLPSQWIYSTYMMDKKNIYYTGNMYSDELFGVRDHNEISWLDMAVTHLEGSESMFERRRNIYDI